MHATAFQKMHVCAGGPLSLATDATGHSNMCMQCPAGDSRAVIQRDGSSIALTSDHKPEREDEAARIRSAGGRIVRSNGALRVMGMLAMSRAVGDHYLRPYVIAEPEVSCMVRCHGDQVLILATDGLWDVFRCAVFWPQKIDCLR